MIITSIIPGRIRIRDQRLTLGNEAEHLRSSLLAMPDVCGVTVAPRTGSLLITCSSATETMQQILAFLTTAFGGAESSSSHGACRGPELFSPTARLHKNTVNLGMIISLLTSLAGVALGAETLHIAAGVLFLAALSVHLFERRRAIYISG